MYLNELRIDDFGCFRNARLDNLDESLVVIGGPQRAGKTTFMQALRQFPNGVGRGGEVPPETDKYRIDAEITHDGYRYRYVLNGHAQPSVSPIGDGSAVTADDIFGPVTERQYRNLYTISLDELRRLPPGIDDSEDLARVLLGGAYGDIAEIPEIEQVFSDQAHTIGLTRGSPNSKTAQLNNPYQTIRDGMEARKEANQQVDEYQAVTDELEEKRTEQTTIEDEIAHRQQIRDRLNVLKELFDPLQELEMLNTRLEGVNDDEVEDFPAHLMGQLEHFEEQFQRATEGLAEARQEFEQQATVETSDEYYNWLLENEAEINGFAQNRKLLASTAEDLIERGNSLDAERQEIERTVSSLYAEWDESFTHIDNIETNAVDTAQVSELASEIGNLQQTRNELKSSIKSATTQKTTLQSDLEEMEEEYEETREITIPKRKPAIIAGIALAVGTGVGFAASPIVGGGVGLIVLVVGLYAIDSTITVETTVDADPYREVKGQVTTLNGSIQAESEQLNQVTEELETAQEELTELVTELGLPENIPSSEVPNFYDQVVELNEEIVAHRREQNAWEENKAEFVTELSEITALLNQVTDISWTPDETLEDANEVLQTLEAIATDLELAQGLHRAEQKRTECVESLNTVLTEWENERAITPATEDQKILKHIQAFNEEETRVTDLQETMGKRERVETQVTSRLENESAREAFEPLREDDEPWIEVIHNVATEYADTEAIADEIRNQRNQIEKLERERDELQRTCIELEQQQEELASEEDLREAQAKIEEGRVEFERLGEAYAVNRIAEQMVKQLHERLMEDIVHSLVDDASEIFSEITQEYEGITLDGDVQSLEFRALREDGPDHGVGELSRATAEQLFLAVRLARIRQTDVSLPVVLDDAATNFDPNHMSRVFNVIEHLAESNQVFFLTCHPQCVQITELNGLSAQYWSLKNGQFTHSETAESLEQELSAD